MSENTQKDRLRLGSTMSRQIIMIQLLLFTGKKVFYCNQIPLSRECNFI